MLSFRDSSTRKNGVFRSISANSCPDTAAPAEFPCPTGSRFILHQQGAIADAVVIGACQDGMS